MKHIQTFYIGCDDDASRAEPEYSAIQRWCGHTIPFYLPIINNLSQHFLAADLAQEEGTLNGPYRLACFVPSHYLEGKYKDTDEDTRIERFTWFLNNFLPPRKGMIVSVYGHEYTSHLIDSTWSSQYLWRSKERWSLDACDENVITLNMPEDSGAVDFKTKNIAIMINRLKREAEKRGLEVIEFDYRTSVEEIYRSLLRSRMHFGYAGGPYFMASLTGTPTLAFGIDEPTLNIRTPGEGGTYPLDYSIWGMAFPNPGHMLRWSNGDVRNRPVDWQSLSIDVYDIYKALDDLLR